MALVGTLVVMVCVASIAVAMQIGQDGLLGIDFANWARKNHRDYVDNEEKLDEFLYRRGIFRENLRKIREMNEQELGSAKYKINKFSDWTPEERRNHSGPRGK